MSFSLDVKEELSKLNNLSNKSYVKAELFGYLATIDIKEKNEEIKFSTESEYNINRFSKLLNNVDIYNYDINIVGKKYSIYVSKKDSKILLELFKEYKFESKEQIEKAYLRGAFLGSGTINNPKNKYHLEVKIKNKDIADNMINILDKYEIKFKVLSSNNKYFIYSKDGEQISKFLAFIEAGNSVLKFEEIRVIRDMRNNINRIVNCETANLSKTVDASIKQIEAINKIKESGRFSNLPDNLKEIAELRIKNPDASLIELGKMLEKPIGKSGVSYRLHTLVKISKEI